MKNTRFMIILYNVFTANLLVLSNYTPLPLPPTRGHSLFYCFRPKTSLICVISIRNANRYNINRAEIFKEEIIPVVSTLLLDSLLSCECSDNRRSLCTKTVLPIFRFTPSAWMRTGKPVFMREPSRAIAPLPSSV